MHVIPPGGIEGPQHRRWLTEEPVLWRDRPYIHLPPFQLWVRLVRPRNWHMGTGTGWLPRYLPFSGVSMV
jgi:hypothetical protein